MSNYHWRVTFTDNEGFHMFVNVLGTYPMQKIRIIKKAMTQLKLEHPWEQERTSEFTRRVHELLAYFDKVTIDVIKSKAEGI
jgi:hypothetical protein